MDVQELLNNFPSMRSWISDDLTAVVQNTKKLLNIKEIYSTMLSRGPERVIEPVEEEAEIITYLHNYLSGKIPDSREEAYRARVEAGKLNDRKRLHTQATEGELFLSLVAAYVTNCANYHFKDRIPDSFLEGSKFNIRYRITKIHILANKIKEENPPGFDAFRRNYADVLKDLTTLNAEDHPLLMTNNRTFYSGDRKKASWDRIVAALMVTAHLVCTVIKENGMTMESRERAGELAYSLSYFLSCDAARELLLKPCSWRNIKFLRDINTTLTNLDIPDDHQKLLRQNPKIAPHIAHLDGQSMEAALEEFIPLKSEEFMGVCEPPIAPLCSLAFNRVPLDPDARAKYIRENIYKHQKFEHIA